MAFKMKAGKEGPMMKNFPGAFKAEKYTTKTVAEGGTRIPAVNIEEKKPRKIRVATTLKPGIVEYKGKYYKSRTGNVPTDLDIKSFPKNEVSKQDAFNYKTVTPEELKKIRSKRKTKEN